MSIEGRFDGNSGVQESITVGNKLPCIHSLIMKTCFFTVLIPDNACQQFLSRDPQLFSALPKLIRRVLTLKPWMLSPENLQKVLGLDQTLSQRRTFVGISFNAGLDIELWLWRINVNKETDI